MKIKRVALFHNLKKITIRILVALVSVSILAVVLFAFVPIPFSAVMAERQVSAWLSGQFTYHAHSQWVSMDNISPWMPLAVIAAEDQKFPQHWGFDVGAVKTVLTQQGEKHLRGASTISQQTAKNVFLWDGRSWVRKGIEAGFTLAIETVWRKKRILTVYLNVAEFGPGIFGVEAASQAYFHKPASRLTATEAAALAAVLPSPLHYKVSSPSPYVRARQHWIERQMQQLGGVDFLQRNQL